MPLHTTLLDPVIRVAVLTLASAPKEERDRHRFELLRWTTFDRADR